MCKEQVTGARHKMRNRNTNRDKNVLIYTEKLDIFSLYLRH